MRGKGRLVCARFSYRYHPHIQSPIAQQRRLLLTYWDQQTHSVVVSGSHPLAFADSHTGPPSQAHPTHACSLKQQCQKPKSERVGKYVRLWSVAPALSVFADSLQCRVKPLDAHRRSPSLGGSCTAVMVRPQGTGGVGRGMQMGRLGSPAAAVVRTGARCALKETKPPHIEGRVVDQRMVRNAAAAK